MYLEQRLPLVHDVPRPQRAPDAGCGITRCAGKLGDSGEQAIVD